MPDTQIETVTVAGRTLEHNTVKWEVKTNRHLTTTGRLWGWIEGAPGDSTWADGESFNCKAASQMAALHNEWLEARQHPEIRRIKAIHELRSAERAYNEAESKAVRAFGALMEAREALAALEAK